MSFRLAQRSSKVLFACRFSLSLPFTIKARCWRVREEKGARCSEQDRQLSLGDCGRWVGPQAAHVIAQKRLPKARS